MTWNHDTLHDKTAAYTLSDKKKSHVNRVNSSGSVKLQNLTFGSEDSVLNCFLLWTSSIIWENCVHALNVFCVTMFLYHESEWPHHILSKEIRQKGSDLSCLKENILVHGINFVFSIRKGGLWRFFVGPFTPSVNINDLPPSALFSKQIEQQNSNWYLVRF